MLRFKTLQSSFLEKASLYVVKLKEIERFLGENSEDWGLLQPEFNREVDGLFEDILLFDMENKKSKKQEDTERLKIVFKKRYGKQFLRGEYINWVYKKPYGYAGDFWIIDALYRNNPITKGVDRLFDNYYLGSPVAQAVRNRKEDFKRILKKFVSEQGKKKIRILNVASGPCREISELKRENQKLFRDVMFDCVDQESDAHDYAKQMIGEDPNVKFINRNVMRISSQTKGITDEYDVIYSMGLFDYLNHDVSVKLINNLKRFLKPQGLLVVANVANEYCNPAKYFMEWVANWELIYRDKDEFEKIFVDAGFCGVSSEFENEGIFQYIKAVNN